MEDYGFKVLEITNKAIEDAKAQAYSKFCNYNFVTNAMEEVPAMDEEKTVQTETIESAKRVEELYAEAISAMKRYSGNASMEYDDEDVY